LCPAEIVLCGYGVISFHSLLRLRMQLYYMLAGLTVVMRAQSRCLTDMPGEQKSVHCFSELSHTISWFSSLVWHTR